MTDSFFRTSVLKLEQPLGIFYVGVIPARILLDVCYSERLKAEKVGDGYELSGAQRERVESRVRDIGRFIDTREAAFPNSILLAANYYEEPLIGEDEGEQTDWRIEANGDCLELVIPTFRKAAAIIDGQHRLYGFTKALNPARVDMPLLCSVFIDLPKPFQAYLFATINSNQRPVDRSQTYELFGYNIDEESEKVWTPEKLAVFIARKLNTESDSPLKERILIAAQNEFVLSRSEARQSGRWMVSMATIVDGILKLISSSPKADAYELRTGKRKKREDIKKPDASPLRKLYVETQDVLIHACVSNYFAVVVELFEGKEASSFLFKTVGVQALFDVLRKISGDALSEMDFSKEFFKKVMQPAASIDFATPEFRNPSGSGRTLIKNTILDAIANKNSQGY